MQSNVVQAHQILAYIFGILAVILNGVLLLSMYNERNKIFVSRISYLVANLAVADCLNGLFLIVLQQPIKDIEYKSEVRKNIQLPFVWTAFCVSFCTLLLMAAERLIVITLPMVWSTILTIRRTIISILAVWVISIIAGAVMYNDKYRYYGQFFICLFVEISALCFIVTHFYILWLLHRRDKHRAIANEVEDPDQEAPCLTASENIAQRKVTIVVSILLVVLIVTCVPYFILLQMFTVNNTFDPTVASKVDLEVYTTAYFYTDSLTYINFFANPIIYAWRLRMYRKAFYSLLGRYKS